jgi:hypothetical protein
MFEGYKGVRDKPKVGGRRQSLKRQSLYEAEVAI